MSQTYSMDYEKLFNSRGGRAGKRNNIMASRNGKYHQAHKYADKRRRIKTAFTKEMTRSYLRLTQKLEQDEEYQKSKMCEEYDMHLEELEKQYQKNLSRMCEEYDMHLEELEKQYQKKLNFQ